MFVGILVAIKGAVEDNPNFEPKEVEAKFPSNNDALKLFTFKDYVTALQAKRECVDNGFSLPSFNFGRRDLQDAGDEDAEGPLCQDFLATSPLCIFGQICECEALLEMETSEGCGGLLKDELWGDTDIDELCPLTCGVCKEGELAPLPKSRLGISGIAPNGYNWQVPFVKCDGRLCEEAGADASGGPDRRGD